MTIDLDVYKTFNAVLDSNIPFPELTRETKQDPTNPVITFRVSRRCLILSGEPDWFYHWYGDNKKTQIAISVARQQGKYVLRFPGLADFLVDCNCSLIQCNPVRGTPAETLRHLLLDQVVPRFIGHQGNLIVHASSVVLTNGIGIAFLGKSGWGKSTLASSFYKQGARLLTDDSLLLDERSGRLIGIPAYAGSRLWQDSVDILFADRADLGNVTHFSSKKRLILHDHESAFPGVELGAIFCLNDPADSAHPGEIKIEPIRGVAAIMALIRRAFVLDVENTRTMASQFDSASRIASTAPVVFSLSFTHDYGMLDTVKAAILCAVDQQSLSARMAI